MTLMAAAVPVTGMASIQPPAVENADGPCSLMQPLLRPRLVNYDPVQVIASQGFLYESFESVPDGSQELPEGWTATCTPGLPSDTWHAGTLGRDGTPMNGVSGYKYAYILGNRESDAAHDAWLFSPGMQMEAGTTYKIEFFAMMPPVTGSDQMEKLQVCIGTQANATAMTQELDIIENNND